MLIKTPSLYKKQPSSITNDSTKAVATQKVYFISLPNASTKPIKKAEVLYFSKHAFTEHNFFSDQTLILCGENGERRENITPLIFVHQETPLQTRETKENITPLILVHQQTPLQTLPPTK